MLKCHKIFVFFYFLNNAVPLGEIFAHLAVHQRYQKGTLDFLYTVQGLLIIININQHGHHLLILNFLNALAELRFVKQVQRRQMLAALLPFLFPAFRFIPKINPSHADTVHPALPCDMDVVVVFFLVQKLPCDRREYGDNGLMVVLVLLRNFGKCLVHPQNLAVVIQQRIRYFKFVQQFLLDRPILGGKADDFIAHRRFVCHKNAQHHHKINCRKHGYADSCLLVKKI